MLSWQMLAAGIPPPSLDNRSHSVSVPFFCAAPAPGAKVLEVHRCQGYRSNGQQTGERRLPCAVIHHQGFPDVLQACLPLTKTFVLPGLSNNVQSRRGMNGAVLSGAIKKNFYGAENAYVACAQRRDLTRLHQACLQRARKTAV